MALQAFIPKGQNLPSVFVLAEEDARILKVGSPEFFTHFENLKGRKRIEVVAREGDTFQTIAKRYGLTMGMLERINHRSRSTPLNVGDKFVVYIPSSSGPADAPGEKVNAKSDVAVATSGDAVGDETPKDKDDDVRPASLRMTPDEPAGVGEKDAPALPPPVP
jgi:membrane-bound lytic murein transglycosylase D